MKGEAIAVSCHRNLELFEAQGSLDSAGHAIFRLHAATTIF